MLSETDKKLFIHLEEYGACSIRQAYRLFYNNTKYGYDIARKRLKVLSEQQLLKSYINQTTNEKIYYIDNRISTHNLFVLNFYSLLHFYGCKNIKFKKEPRYLKGVFEIRPDGFFQFEYGENIFFILLEVDFTHNSMGKMQRYEKLYKSGELQEQCYNTFPLLIIAGFDNNIKYESSNFDIWYTDFKFTDFGNKILGIA